ncbi:MAG: Jag N-terminal domain-containing protein [Oscillospiraceae bacterium]|nr:Jag N-terminal domain-containing protein [Oscillospiraceae bacterium]
MALLSIEKTAKTVEEAHRAALMELGVPEEDTVMEVLEEASKGFLGLIGGHDARVRVTVKEKAPEPAPAFRPEPAAKPSVESKSEATAETSEPAPAEAKVPCRLTPEEAEVPLQKAEAFLQQIFRAMDMQVAIEREVTETSYTLSFVGENLGILIGKHGQTLDSLQYLTNLAANHGMTDKHIHVVLNIENYRERREETLQRLASRLADKVARTHQRILLEPMNRHERKVIHVALQGNRRVTTYSSGDEPYRKVVIEPTARERRSGYRGRRREDYRRPEGREDYRRTEERETYRDTDAHRDEE